MHRLVRDSPKLTWAWAGGPWLGLSGSESPGVPGGAGGGGRPPYQLLQVIVLLQHLHQTQDALVHDGVVFQLQFEDRRVGLRPSPWERKKDKEVVSE